MQESFDQHFAAQVRKELNAELTLSFRGRLKDGFRIGPGDGSYQVSFTADDFERFFRTYLREQTSQLLYGEKQQ
jgi:V/A-type H+-transporting ATPase subunit E